MVKTIELDFEKDPIRKDKKIKNLVEKYKNYNSIRRNLRVAHSIVESLIEDLKKMLDETVEGGSYLNEDVILSISSRFVHSIILYSKWFPNTTGKPKLCENTFFSENELVKDHKTIITLRNKYVAHYELDILGRDMVLAEFDDSNKFIKVSSIWKEQLNLSIDELMAFKACIQRVHNKIDSEIIKKLEDDLNKALESSLEMMNELVTSCNIA